MKKIVPGVQTRKPVGPVGLVFAPTLWGRRGVDGTFLSCSSQTTRAPEWNLLENLKNRSTPHRTLVILADSSFEKTHLSGGGRRSPVLLMCDTSGNVFEDFPDSWREISFFQVLWEKNRTSMESQLLLFVPASSDRDQSLRCLSTSFSSPSSRDCDPSLHHHC